MNGSFVGATVGVVAALLALPASVSAAELGRQDLVSPGAMVSVCGGMNWSGSGYAIGDKGVWLPGLANCNAAMTSSPSATLAESASYVVSTPEPVTATAHGEATMGQLKLYAYSKATPAAGFAQAEATGGWADTLTVMPANAADFGKIASFSFAMHITGTLSGQGLQDSFNSGVSLGVAPYIDGVQQPGFVVGGQGQFGFPYNETVDELVVFTGSITLGTSFELGIFARALAGNASSGSVYTFNEATADFSNTLTWAGISQVAVDGVALDYSVVSASGIDWTQPYTAAVPEPATWLLMVLGLAVGASRIKRRMT